jgi:hypothetical protein
MPTVRTASATGLTAALVTGCSLLSQDASEPPRSAHGFEPGVSLTTAGERLVESSRFAGAAPRYDVRADIAPEEGSVSGRVTASVPVGDAQQAELRYLAGLDAVEAEARIGKVTVDGDPAEAGVDGSIVTVQLPPDHGPRVELMVPFSYRLPPSEPAGLLDALGGIGSVGDVGLLARHEDVMNLGHWFPIWVPEGKSTEAEPAGYGDIGNFPAALIRAELTVPRGWTVVGGGVHTTSGRSGSSTTVGTEGYGIRDLAVSVLRGYAHREMRVRGLPGVTVRAWAPRSAQAELPDVLDEAALSLRVLSDRFVPYPWRELDVVSTPLGAGVAGMEWPGVVWIETSVLAGGVPGLGSLGELFGEPDAGEPGDLGGLEGLLGDDMGRTLDTTRLWTLAHEVGHEWWHVLVGNDSLLDPAVDEPLAQYSACLVMRASAQTDPEALCEAHIRSGYEQMRLLGTPDAPATRESDEFASSLQYAGLVYGKAAAFYTALEDRFGRGEVSAALDAVTEQHAFAMLTTEQLRDALDRELGADGTFADMWRRWMRGTHGDQDLGLE